MEYKDGVYNIGVNVSGGDDSVQIQNPTSCEIKDGEMTATVIWKDSDIDTMIVNDVEYTPVKDNGSPTFKISVPELDKDIAVHTETVAGTQVAKEDYTLHFKSNTLTKLNGSFLSSELVAIVLVLALVGVGERFISTFIRSKRGGSSNGDNGVIESDGRVVDDEE
ncbi:MAG: hypothetical protein IKV96_00360 [Firmicutes bacterium]|nr:hypothetical protein [Bacillota bacterium]